MGEAGTAITAVLLGVLTVAIVAVIVGQNAQTAGVLTAGGTAFSSIINAAVAPVSGGTGISQGH